MNNFYFQKIKNSLPPSKINRWHVLAHAPREWMDVCFCGSGYRLCVRAPLSMQCSPVGGVWRVDVSSGELQDLFGGTHTWIWIRFHVKQLRWQTVMRRVRRWRNVDFQLSWGRNKRFINNPQPKSFSVFTSSECDDMFTCHGPQPSQNRGRSAHICQKLIQIFITKSISFLFMHKQKQS